MKKILALLLCAPCVLLCSCGDISNVQTNANAARATIRDGVSRTYDRQPPYAMLANSRQSELDIQNAAYDDRAAVIAAAVKAMPGIQTASAVVTGDSALVDIAVKGSPSDAEMIQIKNEVRRRVLELDRGLKTATVAAAHEMTENLHDKADLDGVEQTHPHFDSNTERVLRKLTPPA